MVRKKPADRKDGLVFYKTYYNATFAVPRPRPFAQRLCFSLRLSTTLRIRYTNPTSVLRRNCRPRVPSSQAHRRHRRRPSTTTNTRVRLLSKRTLTSTEIRTWRFGRSNLTFVRSLLHTLFVA